MKRLPMSVPALLLGLMVSAVLLVSEQPAAHGIHLEGDAQYTHDPSIIY